MSFLRQIGGIAIFGTALRPEPLAKYAERWEWLFMSFWTISIANDFMITAALVGLLFRERTNAHKRYAFSWCPMHSPASPFHLM
jgi:hypothetical protein